MTSGSIPQGGHPAPHLPHTAQTKRPSGPVRPSGRIKPTGPIKPPHRHAGFPAAGGYGADPAHTRHAPAMGAPRPHRGGLMLGLALFGLIMPITSVAAVVMAGNDLKRMRRHVMDRSGEGLTRAGYWIGMATLLLWIAAVLLIAILIMAGAALLSLKN